MSDVPRPLALLALVCAMLLGPAVVLFLSEGSALDGEAMWIGLANDVFVGFTITSVGMILLLVAYGDNRDRPAAPVFGLRCWPWWASCSAFGCSKRETSLATRAARWHASSRNWSIWPQLASVWPSPLLFPCLWLPLACARLPSMRPKTLRVDFIKGLAVARFLR